ncbi:MAG: hypothetical protein KJ858_02420, partial [Nanoarchaeota archaeon]|nr:hypothetical protein [Nanoarchaeota archaeon]
MELNWKELFGYHEFTDRKESDAFLKKGFHVVDCDASYKEFVGSCSIQIRSMKKENKIKSRPFTAIGPNESEMMAILHGIREAKKIKGIKKALFTNDNNFAIDVIVGNSRPSRENIKKAASKIKKELSDVCFEYEFARVKGKVNSRVDRHAKKELKKKEIDIDKLIESRIKRVLTAQSKAKNLECKQKTELIYAVKSEDSDKWYDVNLDSLSCSCPYWKNNWSKKPEGAKWTRATPCK